MTALPAPEPAPGPEPKAAGGTGRADRLRALGLALALAALYLAPSELLPGHDATGNVYTAASIVSDGRLTLCPSRLPFLFEWRDPRPGGESYRILDLDEAPGGVSARQLAAAGALVPAGPYFLNEAARPDPATGERCSVNGFGPGAALSALPVLAPLGLAVGDLTRRPGLLWAGARVAAALLTAAAAAFLFLAARRWLSAGAAVGLALLFALGTPAWSSASQTLWQHPADLFFLSLGALCLVRARGGRAAAALAGLAFGMAAACRPHSAAFAAAGLAWLLLEDRRAAAAFAAGAAPPVLGLLAFNWWYLGGPLTFGQVEAARTWALQKTGVADPWPCRLGESLPGLLLSPSRGLLVFSPFLALAGGGAALAFRRRELAPLRPLAAAALLVLAVEACWYDWWGGWSYGWRRLTALAPALTLLLVPLAGWLGAARWRLGLLAALAGWSVALQGLGALAYDVEGWNGRRAWRVARPSGEVETLVDEEAASAAVARGGRLLEAVALDVDRAEHRHRLWSLSDSQPLFTIRHFTELRRSRREAAALWVEQFGPPR